MATLRPAFNHLLFTAVTLGVAAPAGVTYAQQGAALEEIVVTARQREESLRDVPVTVTALTEAELARAGVERAEDFIALTPGVTIVDAAEVGDTQVNIRGINGARDAENSFALIIDGVLQTNPAALNREYADLQQVEILKGPQGAIYGRNAAAGAIIITTKEPTNEFEASVRGSVASDSTYYASATVGGPLSEDKAFFRLNANWRTSDGYFTNSFQNADIVDDFENYNLNGRLIIQPNDNVTWDIKARYGEVDAASISFNAAFALPTFAAVLGNPDFFEDVNDHNFTFTNNIDPQNDQEATEFSVKLDWALDWGDLTAWALYSNVEQSFSADGTSGAFGFFNADPQCINTVATQFANGVTFPSPQFLGPDPASSIFGPYTSTACDGTQFQVRDQEDISFEVRLASSGDSALRWLAGAYFLQIDRQVGVNTGIDRGFGITESLFVPAGGQNPTDQLLWDDFDSDVFAVFGQLAYDLTDTVEASLALRYDREEREVRSLVPTDARSTYIDFNPIDGFTGGDPINPALNPAINPTGVIAPADETFDEVQPKVSISWDVNDDWTLFGSWGVGFKSGGFNSQGSNATIDLFFNQPLGTNLQIQDQFAEETSSSFEAGFKSRLLGGRMSFEGAVYRVDVDDMQFFEFLVGPFGLLRVVSNIDEVELQGVELAVNTIVTDNFSLFGGISFNDSEITANSARPETVGNKSPYTPDWTFNVAGNFDYPVSDNVNFIASIIYSAVGPTWFHTVQDETRITLFDLAFPGLGTADYVRTERDSYGIIDARLGFESDTWSVVAFAKNLADEDYLEEVIPAPEFGGSFIHPGAERRFGLEFTYNF